VQLSSGSKKFWVIVYYELSPAAAVRKCPTVRQSIVIGLIGVPAIVVTAALAGWFWLQTSLPRTSGSVHLDGIKAQVSIVRDENGIPHILAESDNDGYFALGYVHAQDRFWQMETMRRFGAGRLSEIMGEATLGTDKWMRTLGLYHLAEDQAEALDPPIRQALQSYADGVNSWLNTKFGLPGLEFAGFRYTPDPWKAADSLVWGKIMATRLAGNFRTEILRSLIAKRIPPERVGELWPTDPEDAPVTVSDLPAALSENVLRGLASLSPWPVGHPTGASNFWAIGPEKTDTEGAFMANDPHLGFSAPIMWYLAKIKTPHLKVMGATVPGVPFHVLGTNTDIAWGVTSTQADSEDLFIEKLSSRDSSRYQKVEGDTEFDVRHEVITIKGQEDFELTVRATHHGPVISDLRADARRLGDDGHVVALSATYLQENDLTSGAFYHLNRAKNWPEFEKGLRDVDGPVLNFVYADSAGNIGFRTAGKIPLRGQGSGVVPSPGWLGRTDWQGYVPFNEMPSQFNPPAALVVNANNRVIAKDASHFITHNWAARYRAERILQRLNGDGEISLETMQSVQNDTLSLMAKDLLPKLLELASSNSDEDGPVIALLRKWNGVMARDRIAPLIFSTWVLELNKLIYGDELAELTPSYLTLRPQFLNAVLFSRPHWCDDVNTSETETCADLVTKALAITISQLTEKYGENRENWLWGNAHRATFSHQVLSRIPLLNRLADISIASDGGNYTVNRGATRVNNTKAPFAHIHGPGFRAVYDLADINRSKFMIATGQSGNPLSAHYADLLTRWRDGKYVRFASDDEGLQAARSEKMILMPKSLSSAKSAGEVAD
jgi:penicillin G amidase